MIAVLDGLGSSCFSSKEDAADEVAGALEERGDLWAGYSSESFSAICEGAT